jgi:RNA polymerase sigma-70 factor (ECF subfamily)
VISTLNLTGASHVWTDEGHLVPGQRGAEVVAQVIERPTPDQTPRAIARSPSPPAASSAVEPVPARPLQLTRPAVFDRAELAERIERRLASSYRLAAIARGDRVDAEDATHEAILSAWARAGTLRDPAAFDAWFDRILVNVCRDRLRHRRRAPRWGRPPRGRSAAGPGGPPV